MIWASYAAILGYSFGTKFEDDHTTAFLLAFGAALSITVLIEVVRFARKKFATD
jgi:membrane protein DedA with SNARE-associated domain